MREARDRADRMPIEEPIGAGASSGHEPAERRALAYHRAIASRLDPRMVGEAWYRVYKWRELDRLDPRYADEWQAILERSLDQVRRAIVEESPWGNDLRQNSPFAGMLSEPERRRLLQVA